MLSVFGPTSISDPIPGVGVNVGRGAGVSVAVGGMLVAVTVAMSAGGMVGAEVVGPQLTMVHAIKIIKRARVFIFPLEIITG